ncbi:MAG TPA: TIGR01777 family oxidoreductase [Balneolaceae bacterium]
MNIFLTGATGFIGSYLRTMLLRKGYLLTMVTRTPEKYENETAQNQRFVSWDDDLVAEMENTDVVINMAGSSIFGRRWTGKVKKDIYESRIESTNTIVDAIKQAKNPPSVLISVSAAGYYGDRGDMILDESSKAGDDFLARLCVDWEAAAQGVTEAGVRLAIPRFGVVLEQNGGALQQMLPAFKLFVGGPVGSGDQYFPWIHVQDICRGINFAIENEGLEGAFNLSAPNPVTMNQFADALADKLNRPSLFRVPEFVLEFIFADAAGPVVNSVRLQPKKIKQHGFEFRYKHLDEALSEIF